MRRDCGAVGELRGGVNGAVGGCGLLLYEYCVALGGCGWAQCEMEGASKRG